MKNIRKFAATILFAGITAITVASPASAAGSWTCHGTAGSKVDPPTSCSTSPAPLSQAPGYLYPQWLAGHHRHGNR